MKIPPDPLRSFLNLLTPGIHWGLVLNSRYKHQAEDEKQANQVRDRLIKVLQLEPTQVNSMISIEQLRTSYQVFIKYKAVKFKFNHVMQFINRKLQRLLTEYRTDFLIPDFEIAKVLKFSTDFKILLFHLNPSSKLVIKLSELGFNPSLVVNKTEINQCSEGKSDQSTTDLSSKLNLSLIAGTSTAINPGDAKQVDRASTLGSSDNSITARPHPSIVCVLRLQLACDLAAKFELEEEERASRMALLLGINDKTHRNNFAPLVKSNLYHKALLQLIFSYFSAAIICKEAAPDADNVPIITDAELLTEDSLTAAHDKPKTSPQFTATPNIVDNKHDSVTIPTLVYEACFHYDNPGDAWSGSVNNRLLDLDSIIESVTYVRDITRLIPTSSPFFFTTPRYGRTKHKFSSIDIFDEDLSVVSNKATIATSCSNISSMEHKLSVPTSSVPSIPSA